MLSKDQITALLKERSAYLAAEYGVQRIGLFGSYVQGNYDQDSDIDLVIEFERPIGLRFVTLVEDLEALLGREVDVLTPAGLQGIRVGHIAEEIEKSIEYV